MRSSGTLTYYSVDGEYGPGHHSFYTNEEGFRGRRRRICRRASSLYPRNKGRDLRYQVIYAFKDAALGGAEIINSADLPQKLVTVAVDEIKSLLQEMWPFTQDRLQVLHP